MHTYTHNIHTYTIIDNTMETLIILNFTDQIHPQLIRRHRVGKNCFFNKSRLNHRKSLSVWAPPPGGCCYDNQEPSGPFMLAMALKTSLAKSPNPRPWSSVLASSLFFIFFSTEVPTVTLSLPTEFTLSPVPPPPPPFSPSPANWIPLSTELSRLILLPIVNSKARLEGGVILWGVPEPDFVSETAWSLGEGGRPPRCRGESFTFPGESLEWWLDSGGDGCLLLLGAVGACLRWAWGEAPCCCSQDSAWSWGTVPLTAALAARVRASCFSCLAVSLSSCWAWGEMSGVANMMFLFWDWKGEEVGDFLSRAGVERIISERTNPPPSIKVREARRPTAEFTGCKLTTGCGGGGACLLLSLRGLGRVWGASPLFGSWYEYFLPWPAMSG